MPRDGGRGGGRRRDMVIATVIPRAMARELARIICDFEGSMMRLMVYALGERYEGVGEDVCWVSGRRKFRTSI
jgi:hypothetical protein